MKGFYSYGRDALLLETLSIVAKCQDERTFWTEALARLKWIVDFTRVDVALRNQDNQTYNLQTLFELRPDEPLVKRERLCFVKSPIPRTRTSASML